jgi:FKBP-type peptidyl-prolyl cis-trans isomerase 2
MVSVETSSACFDDHGVDKMPVKKGDRIKVEYTGTLEDGTVFDATEKHGAPLEFEVGSGQLIKGFDDAVMGMELGAEKEIKLKPAEAYGEPKDDMMKKVPRDQLPKDQDPKEGMMLVIGLPNGQQIPAKIAKVDDAEVTIDLNHPLAGKTLKFKIKISEICNPGK